MMVQTKADDISEAEHSKMVWSPVVGVSMTGFVHGGSFLQEQCHTWKCIHALSINRKAIGGHWPSGPSASETETGGAAGAIAGATSAISMMLSRAPDIFPWPRSLHISLLALALQKPEVWRLEGHGFSLLSRKLRVFYGNKKSPCWTCWLTNSFCFLMENHHVEQENNDKPTMDWVIVRSNVTNYRTGRV